MNFRKVAQAWRISDRRGRMRYLIDNLTVNDEVCFCLYGPEVFVSRSSDGRYVIPIWPDEDCFRATTSEEFAADLEIVAADKKSFEEQVLADMRDGELLAVFPNAEFEYELFDEGEMRRSIEYRDLYWRAKAGKLTEADAEKINRYFPLKSKR